MSAMRMGRAAMVAIGLATLAAVGVGAWWLRGEPAGAAAAASQTDAAAKSADKGGDAGAGKGGGQSGAAKAGGKSAARPALVVTTVRPVTAQVPLTLAANGSVAAWQEASIGAEANGLRIAEVKVDVGDTVRRGQVLVVMASDTVRADLAAAEASLADTRAMLGELEAGLAEAQAAAAEAKANADRARVAEPSGALSAVQVAQYLTGAQTAQARVQSAQARVRAGQARVQSATAQVQAQQLRLRMTQVLAPDDGLISSRTATVGAVVPAGQELLRLVRGNRIEWRAEVTATELGRLRPGQAVRVMPAAGGEVRGTVRTVGPVVDAQTRNALVYVDLPAGSSAKPGMFARGEFDLGASSALTVPQAAVVVRDGFAFVFRLDGSRVVQEKVRIGRRVGDRIEILDGVAPDAVLVASGAGFLNDGDIVQVSAEGASK